MESGNPYTFFLPIADPSKAPAQRREPLEQSKDFHIVVTAKDAEQVYDLDPKRMEKLFPDFVKQLGCKYWAILHDRDVDIRTGKPKYLHWHIVVHMVRSRRVKSAMIKKVANALGVAENRVSVMISYDLQTDIRYLMHLDDYDKWLYQVDDVVTNDERTLLLAYNDSLNELTFERLKDACELANGSLSGIMQIIGVKLYKNNAVAIHDYVKERNEYAIQKVKAKDPDEP